MKLLSIIKKYIKRARNWKKERFCKSVSISPKEYNIKERLIKRTLKGEKFLINHHFTIQG